MQRRFTDLKRYVLFCFAVCMLYGCRTAENHTVSGAAFSSAAGESATEKSGADEISESMPLPDIASGIEDISASGQPEKLVAFTFDDGPGDYTAALLDGLAQRDAKATFFIATNRVSAKNADLIRRMDAEGHTVANHTVSHLKLHLLPTEQIQKEISDADTVLHDITGKTPQLLRPPYGNFTARVLQAAGKPAIVWSIDTKDCFDNKDAQGIRQLILDRVTDGDIILLHEWGEYSKDGALLAMDTLAQQGYRFVTVPELFDAKEIPLEAGSYYAAANGKDFEERIVFDTDDPYAAE